MAKAPAKPEGKGRGWWVGAAVYPGFFWGGGTTWPDQNVFCEN